MGVYGNYKTSDSNQHNEEVIYRQILFKTQANTIINYVIFDVK